MIPTDLYDDYTAALSENDRQAKMALKAVIAQAAPGGIDALRDALLDAYPALVRVYGTRAAQVALEFYMGVRTAQGIESQFDASLPSDDGSMQEECVSDVRREVKGLYSGENTIEAFTSTMQKLATKRTMQMASDTLHSLAEIDPAHPKVALVPHLGACGWCVMIGSRGFTNSERAMDNMRHDGCKCATVVDFDTKNPALKGYDPDAMYQLYKESCTEEDMRQWASDWRAMSAEERAKYVRRTRDRTGAVKETPGDWSTYVRNRTAQNMDRLMRDQSFTGGHEELAEWLPSQRAAMNANRSETALSASEQIKDQYPKVYDDWQSAVTHVGEAKTSQSIRQHIPGTREYEKASNPSWFYVNEDEPVEQRVDAVRRMIDESAGSGIPGIDKNGKWNHKERVTTGGIIGVDGRSHTETKTMVIHYGKDKVHASPTYDGSGKRID